MKKKSKFCVHRDLTNAFTARETIPVVFERSVSREFQVLDFDAARLSRVVFHLSFYHVVSSRYESDGKKKVSPERVNGYLKNTKKI
jgi:hypothetical protein